VWFLAISFHLDTLALIATQSVRHQRAIESSVTSKLYDDVYH